MTNNSLVGRVYKSNRQTRLYSTRLRTIVSQSEYLDEDSGIKYLHLIAKDYYHKDESDYKLISLLLPYDCINQLDDTIIVGDDIYSRYIPSIEVNMIYSSDPSTSKSKYYIKVTNSLTSNKDLDRVLILDVFEDLDNYLSNNETLISGLMYKTSETTKVVEINIGNSVVRFYGNDLVDPRS